MAEPENPTPVEPVTEGEDTCAADTGQDQNIGLASGPEETWTDRLYQEGVELAARLEKLTEFMGGPKYDTLPLPDRELLRAQHTYMSKYLSVLAERASRIRIAGSVADNAIGPAETGEELPHDVADE